MSQRKITFDPKGASSSNAINNRKVINGEDDGLMQVAPLKHQWADDILTIMIQNTWLPQEVPMTKDIEQWKKGELSENEMNTYKRALAFVSNLDGIQTTNISENILRQITSPEVKMALTRQAWEEIVHVMSYTTLIESLGLDPDEIYGMYKRDKDLYKKNKYVLDSFRKISENGFKTGNIENDKIFLESCVANIALEGIYFYSAFLIFYVLRRNNKMQGSAEMIQFINKDEDMHLQLFITIFDTIKKEQPELWDDDMKKRSKDVILGAYEHELDWGLSCIGDGILGLTKESLDQYLKFISDVRLKNIGIPAYFEVSNPFPWLDEITSGSMIETNFFEGTVKEYAGGALEW